MVERKCYRGYTRHSYKGKSILVSWTDRRCVRCQRFLSKLQIKYCNRCSKVIEKIRIKKYHNTEHYKKLKKEQRKRFYQSEKGKEYDRIRKRVYRHPERFNVGDYV